MKPLDGEMPIKSTHPSIAELARQQGVVVYPFEELLGDFWPEEESADDFVAEIRDLRHQDHQTA